MSNRPVDILSIIKAEEQTAAKNYSVHAAGSSTSTGAQGLTEIVELLYSTQTVHYITHGAWSMYQLLQALILECGESVVYLSTYSISETAMRMLANLKHEGLLKQLHVLIDSRVETRTAKSMQLVKGMADRYKLLPCHAKVTIIEGKKQSYCISGSANYTENRRAEVGAVTSEPAIINFYKTWMLDEFGNQ